MILRLLFILGLIYLFYRLLQNLGRSRPPAAKSPPKTKTKPFDDSQIVDADFREIPPGEKE